MEKKLYLRGSVNNGERIGFIDKEGTHKCIKDAHL